MKCPFQLYKERKSKPLQGYSFTALHFANELPEVWDSFIGKNHFLSREYLQTIEATPPAGISFRYLMYYKGADPVGIAYLQLAQFRAIDSIRALRSGNRSWLPDIRRWISKGINFSMLVCGNLMLTGGDAFAFKDGMNKEKMDLLFVSMEQMRDRTNADSVLIKDLREENRYKSWHKARNTYGEFTIEPNMVLSLPSKWGSFDDYMGALTSKYRVRIRRAIKKGDSIRWRPYLKSDIAARNAEIYSLYLSVAHKADFNILRLHEQYFLNLATRYQENFDMYVWEEDDSIKAFYTLLKNGDQLEAHFLGYDPADNVDKQVYLNMLIRIIQHALDKNCTSIVFARTALEIKSSLGAEPIELYSYFKHKKHITNHIASRLMEWLRPDQQPWQPRRPFKKEGKLLRPQG